MADPRLSAVARFTKTIYTQTDAKYEPAKSGPLPSGFTACIIGAGQGIGEYIAHALSAAGASNLLIAARRTEQLQSVSDKLKATNKDINVEWQACDASDPDAVKKLADFTQSTFGGLDLLVFNAGYAGKVVTRIHDDDLASARTAFDVNALGTYWAAHYFTPLLLSKKDGAKCFVAVNSLASIVRRGEIANTKYCISKLVQLREMEMLHEQYHETDGLCTFAIHPGSVDTEMAQTAPDSFKPYLVDDVSLCGAVLVWILARLGELKWLSGRFISAKWDMEELVAQKDTIVEKDLLKLSLAVS